MEDRILVIGATSTDFILRGTCPVAANEPFSGTDLLISAGGRGANIAVAAARLGGLTGLISRVGNDSRGSEILIHLHNKEHVDTSHVAVDERSPTGACMLVVDDSGRKKSYIMSGANSSLSPADISHAALEFSTAKVVILDCEAQLDTLIFAIEMAHRSGAKIIVDPAPAKKLPRAALENITLIKPNALEAEVLTGIHVETWDDALSACHTLMDQGAGAAVVEVPDTGMLLCWAAGEMRLPHLQIARIDSTGAGDAFGAAFGVKLCEGARYEEAGQFANIAAALTATRLGAQTAFPTRAEVDRVYEAANVIIA